MPRTRQRASSSRHATASSAPPPDPTLRALAPLANAAGILAAHRLAQLLQRSLELTLCRVERGSPADVVGAIDVEETPMVAVHLQLEGEAPARLVVCVEEAGAQQWQDTLLEGLEVVEARREAVRRSALRELANLTAGAFTMVLGSLLQVDVRQGVPADALDHAGAVLGQALQGPAAEEAEVVYVHLRVGEPEGWRLCDILLLPEPKALERLRPQREAP